MPIMRKQKVNRYTTVDNYLIDDKRLDPEGKGYLIYMLRKPDNWHFNYKSIQNDLNVGERMVFQNQENGVTTFIVYKQLVKEQGSKTL